MGGGGAHHYHAIDEAAVVHSPGLEPLTNSMATADVVRVLGTSHLNKLPLSLYHWSYVISERPFILSKKKKGEDIYHCGQRESYGLANQRLPSGGAFSFIYQGVTERTPLLSGCKDTRHLCDDSSTQHAAASDCDPVACLNASPDSISYRQDSSRICVDHDAAVAVIPTVDASSFEPSITSDICTSPFRGRSYSDPVLRTGSNQEMDIGILRALKTVKSNPYVQYVGLGLAGLVTQKELHDQQTGAPLRKTKLQLIRISAAVCGIELCYAAETAFVSPILLKLGVPASLMTMVWCLSPILGFFLVPIMGSLSDRCTFRLGRRRPFIIIMSIGVVLGLCLVPNGEILGIWLGDPGNETINGRPSYNVSGEEPFSHKSSLEFSFSVPPDHIRGIIFTILGVAMLDFNCDACQSPCRAYLLDICVPEDHSTGLTMFTVMAGLGGTVGYVMGGIDWNATSFGEALGGHIRVVFSVVLIAFILFVTSTLTSFREIPLKDLSIKKSEIQKSKKRVGKSKYRKFTNEDSSSSEGGGDEENAQGILDAAANYGALADTASNQYKQKKELSAQSPFVQDKLGAANHGETDWKNVDGPHTGTNKDPENQSPQKTNYPDCVRPNAQQISNGALTFPDLANGSTVGATLTSTADSSSCDKTSARTKPNDQARKSAGRSHIFNGSAVARQANPDDDREVSPFARRSDSAGAGFSGGGGAEASKVTDVIELVEVSTDVTLKTYLHSIVQMPRSMWILCLCNLLCWMSLVCYSLYFTDFVGQSVYGGDPMAPVGSDLHDRYDQGVRLGSFGMSLYSLSCACYSLGIERLVQRFRAKNVYVFGQLAFTLGMAGMAASRSKIAVILLSPAAGIMYATLFTMPYLLVAHYHTRGLFSHGDVALNQRKQVRGLGTDVAIVSSMVFLAQFILSVIMGTVVTAVDSTVAVIITSAILSFLGSLIATQITYLDL
ncbi:hypothetical protein Btru_004669 [Bulinus truncatus]|nr:hypothetical protein Btru_004669 [Bulinus truncatus]